MNKVKNDNSKNTKKKRNNKKQNVKVKIKKNNSKMYLITGIALIIIAEIIFSINFSFENTNINCKKEVKKNDVIIGSNIIVSKKKDSIESVLVTKTINLKDDNSDSYLDAIKTALESHYKEDGITYETSKENDKLIIKLKYTGKKKYILDNLFIEKFGTEININLLSDDREGNYATIDLSKRYNDKNIIKILQRAYYTCKKWKKSKKVEKTLDFFCKYSIIKSEVHVYTSLIAKIVCTHSRSF